MFLLSAKIALRLRRIYFPRAPTLHSNYWGFLKGPFRPRSEIYLNGRCNFLARRGARGLVTNFGDVPFVLRFPFRRPLFRTSADA